MIYRGFEGMFGQFSSPNAEYAIYFNKQATFLWWQFIKDKWYLQEISIICADAFGKIFFREDISYKYSELKCLFPFVILLIISTSP